MSLAEAQQMFTILQSIEQTIAGIEDRISNLNSSSGPESVTAVKFKLYQVERLAIRWLALGRRMGLPDDMGRAIDTVARMVTTIRMLHISMNLMMSTHPLLMAIGFASLLAGSWSMIDTVGGYY